MSRLGDPGVREVHPLVARLLVLQASGFRGDARAGIAHLRSIGELPELEFVSCLACGLCCQMHDYIEIQDGDLARLESDPIGAKVAACADPGSLRSSQPRFDLTGCGRTCPAFQGPHKGCGCYEVRPQACRDFLPGSNACLAVRVAAFAERDRS